VISCTVTATCLGLPVKGMWCCLNRQVLHFADCLIVTGQYLISQITAAVSELDELLTRLVPDI